MDDYIPHPRPRLSDEAAAQLLDFLYDLVADFESAYAGQLLRHRQAEADRQRDLYHMTLFADPNGDPF